MSRWFELAVGDEVAGEGAVTALALFDATVVGEPGDARRIALVWIAGRRGDARPLMVDRDVYGGEEAFDVETLHDLEPVDAAGFAGLTGRLTAGEDVTATAPDGREVAGEPEPIALARAGGADAAGVPARGWVINLFPTDTTDVGRFWLVLFDAGQVPRVAFDARTRKPRAGGW